MVEGGKCQPRYRLNAHFVGKTFDDLTGSFVMDQTSLMTAAFTTTRDPFTYRHQGSEGDKDRDRIVYP